VIREPNQFWVKKHGKNKIMGTGHKILLVDDDPQLLSMYSEILGRLPSSPEVFTASSGARAVAMLEDASIRMLICDLKMPKMDGLQVLAIVRRKYPELRTVVLTSVVDEQFRSRAYALGVDLFWNKPSTEEDLKMFLECLESLLGREVKAGFRGVQSKSLMDLIQLECISQSSSVLRITNGTLTGKIYIHEGEIIDAQAGELAGEAAFNKILSWKNGSFETMTAEPSHPRGITKSYNALLLESAQAIDELSEAPNQSGPVNGPLSQLSQVEGVEFVLAIPPAEKGTPTSYGLENSQGMAAWTRESLQRFHGLGDRLRVGGVEQIEGFGLQRHVSVSRQGDMEFCVGWRYTMSAAQVKTMMKKVLALWAS
jgi:CheY-like chemotaxis protein